MTWSPKILQLSSDTGFPKFQVFKPSKIPSNEDFIIWLVGFPSEWVLSIALHLKRYEFRWQETVAQLEGTRNRNHDVAGFSHVTIQEKRKTKKI